MATAAPDLGKACLAHYREEKRKNEVEVWCSCSQWSL